MTGRVVAIGGGHGLAATLSALVDRCTDLTAVVSVADDGGSSGRLREEIGGPAPGDLRRCLEALVPSDEARAVLAHRFSSGSLDGHAAGNLLIEAAWAETTDPVAALDLVGAMVGARGHVLPATLDAVELVAETRSGQVRGQVAISTSTGIVSVATVPADPRVPERVVTAIGAADLVVLGPGSLFTSVLAAVVPAVRVALVESAAHLLYVANLAPQVGETEGLTVAEHVDAVRRHGVDPDTVLVDRAVGDEGDLAGEMRVVRAAVADPAGVCHHPEALGRVVSELLSNVSA